MLRVTSSSPRLKTTRGTVVLVGFIFVFVIASVAIGFRASNAFVPAMKGCHGGGDGDGQRTCTTTSVVSTSSVTSTKVSTTSSTSDQTTTTTSEQSTTSTANGQNQIIVPSAATCSPLNGIVYQGLEAGTQLVIAFNGNSQMTFAVPAQSFTWNWYWIPANGQDLSTLQMQITNSMWSSGHGQNFSFFVASLDGQSGIVLQTDYALSQACG
jgi:hypothetical protein